MIQEMRLALRNNGMVNPESIDSYLAVGGYEALKKARGMDPAQLIHEIEGAGKLRGRGGAGFNTGFKWSGAASVQSDVKYVVCNADEGEPGTYKDRTIMEGDPHTLIEGILICAYAIGAKEAFIYCRGEYESCIRLLRGAIAQAEEKGLCGDVRIRVHSGAGSYVCGEETTLLTSLEGYRGEPRLKPPFPTESGYMGKPTVVNNVETFSVVPVIVGKGADWFGSIGAPKYPGTKIFSLSGDVKNRGCFEVPTNSNLKEIIEELGGGTPDGKKIKAIQVGGSSCAFLKPEQMDTSVDFDSMREIGASLGSGAVLVIDESRDMMELLAGIAHFFNHESCGKCVPCREGSYRVAEIMDKFAAKHGTKEDLEILKNLSNVMEKACFCPLGQSVCVAIMSALQLFPEDFEMAMEVK